MSRRYSRTTVVLALGMGWGVGGCSLLGGGGSGDDGEETSTSGDDDGESGDTDDDTLPDIPDEGFRVFPKFALVDVPAIVTIEENQVFVQCPLDPMDGGYLCDASEIAGPTANVHVERDGFDPAVRAPEIVPGQLTPLDVHLAEAGGTTGTWSACTALSIFGSCDELCEAETLTCTVANCDTEDLATPIATFQLFATEDCAAPAAEHSVTPCPSALPDQSAEIVAARCCCSA